MKRLRRSLLDCITGVCKAYTYEIIQIIYFLVFWDLFAYPGPGPGATSLLKSQRSRIHTRSGHIRLFLLPRIKKDNGQSRKYGHLVLINRLGGLRSDFTSQL